MDGFRCSRCKTVKAPEEFAPSQRVNGGWCRECHRAYYRAKAPAPPPGFGTCEWCGKDIDNPITNRRRFCDGNCKARAAYARKNPKPKRSCDYCGIDITHMRSDARFCSEDHATKANNKSRTPAQRRADKLRSLYGITPEDYDRMLAEQDGRCAICRGTEPRAQFDIWQIDHCHDSGRVRGLLCGPCNTGLGQLGDNIETLRSAIRYLEGAEERCTEPRSNGSPGTPG